MVYLISTSITIVLWGYLGCFTSIRYDLLSAARSSQTKCSWVVTFIEHQDISSVIIFVMSNRKEQTKICNSLLSRWLIHNRTVMETNVTILQEENMKLLHNKDAFSFEIAWILLKFYQSGRLRKLQSNARKTNLSRYEKHCSSNNNFNLSKMYGQARVKLASEGEHFELCNLLFTRWEFWIRAATKVKWRLALIRNWGREGMSIHDSVPNLDHYPLLPTERIQ